MSKKILGISRQPTELGHHGRSAHYREFNSLEEAILLDWGYKDWNIEYYELKKLSPSIIETIKRERKLTTLSDKLSELRESQEATQSKIVEILDQMGRLKNG